MHCFYHDTQPALGLCQYCKRGLCRNCAAEAAGRLACRDRHERDVKALHAPQRPFARYVTSAFNAGIGLLFLLLGWHANPIVLGVGALLLLYSAGTAWAAFRAS